MYYLNQILSDESMVDLPSLPHNITNKQLTNPLQFAKSPKSKQSSPSNRLSKQHLQNTIQVPMVQRAKK